MTDFIFFYLFFTINKIIIIKAMLIESCFCLFIVVKLNKLKIISNEVLLSSCTLVELTDVIKIYLQFRC